MVRTHSKTFTQVQSPTKSFPPATSGLFVVTAFQLCRRNVSFSFRNSPANGIVSKRSSSSLSSNCEYFYAEDLSWNLSSLFL